MNLGNYFFPIRLGVLVLTLIILCLGAAIFDLT